MLVNRFDIIDAMIYASNNEDVNIFLQLETLLIGNDFPAKEILVVEEKLLDYIEKLKSERYSLVENDINKEKRINNSLDEEDIYPSLYNCNITDFYEEPLVRNNSMKKIRTRQRKNTRPKV